MPAYADSEMRSHKRHPGRFEGRGFGVTTAFPAGTTPTGFTTRLSVDDAGFPVGFYLLRRRLIFDPSVLYGLFPYGLCFQRQVEIVEWASG